MENVLIIFETVGSMGSRSKLCPVLSDFNRQPVLKSEKMRLACYQYIFHLIFPDVTQLINSVMSL